MNLHSQDLTRWLKSTTMERSDWTWEQPLTPSTSEELSQSLMPQLMGANATCQHIQQGREGMSMLTMSKERGNEHSHCTPKAKAPQLPLCTNVIVSKHWQLWEWRFSTKVIANLVWRSQLMARLTHLERFTQSQLTKALQLEMTVEDLFCRNHFLVLTFSSQFLFQIYFNLLASSLVHYNIIPLRVDLKIEIRRREDYIARRDFHYWIKHA